MLSLPSCAVRCAPSGAMRMESFLIGMGILLGGIYPLGQMPCKGVEQICIRHAYGGYGSRLAYGSTQTRRVGGQSVEGNSVKSAFIG